MARRRVPADPRLELMRKNNDLVSALEALIPSHWGISVLPSLYKEENLRSYRVDITVWKSGSVCLTGVIVDEIMIYACREAVSQLSQVRLYNPFGNEWITIWPKELQASDVPCETSDNRGFSAFPSDYTRRLDAENR